MLALFVSLSLFTAYEAVRPSPSLPEGRARRGEGELRLDWWIASGICIGFAFLTKGPIAIVLWLPPVFAIAWLSDSHAKPRWWHYGILGSVAGFVAMPWFVLVHHQDPTFLIEFFYKHNVARFAGEFLPKPFWYFVPIMLVAGHPWSFLTIPYARFLFGRNEEDRSSRPPEVGFLLLWSVWCFAFFSMSKCKLPTYLLPAAPASALMIGHYLGEVLRDADNRSRHFFARFWSARSATATTCFAGMSFVMYVMATNSVVTVFTYGWAMMWTSLLGTSLLLLGNRYQAKIAWGTSTGVAFLFAVMVMHQMVPAYSRSQTLFGDTSALIKQLNVNPQSAIATVDHEFSEVPFDLNRRDIPNFDDVHDKGLGEFVTRSGTAILIVDDRIEPEAVLQQLHPQTRLAEVAHRGSARIYQATTSEKDPQIAAKTLASTTKIQR